MMTQGAQMEDKPLTGEIRARLMEVFAAVFGKAQQ